VTSGGAPIDRHEVQTGFRMSSATQRAVSERRRERRKEGSVKTVKAVPYTMTICYRASIHDFQLTGPGVNMKTAVVPVKTYTWKVVTLTPGRARSSVTHTTG